MTTFRVHFEMVESGERGTSIVLAKTPDDAAKAFRTKQPGAIVRKVKVDRSNR